MKPWMYILAAVLGSLGGAILDATLYRDGGSMFMKIGLVAGPALLYGAGLFLGGKEDASEDGS